jgi:flagellar basal-body rod modification protein FlgD
MSAIPQTNSTGPIATTASTANAAKTKAPTNELGKDDFLKLLAAQLQYQNPMDPMDNTQFVSQMANFSSLEQITNLATAQANLTKTVTAQQSIALIGHTVSYVGSDDAVKTGVVKSVETAGGIPTLTIDGVSGVDPSYVSQIT